MVAIRGKLPNLMERRKIKSEWWFNGSSKPRRATITNPVGAGLAHLETPERAVARRLDTVMERKIDFGGHASNVEAADCMHQSSQRVQGSKRCIRTVTEASSAFERLPHVAVVSIRKTMVEVAVEVLVRANGRELRMPAGRDAERQNQEQARDGEVKSFIAGFEWMVFEPQIGGFGGDAGAQRGFLFGVFTRNV